MSMALADRDGNLKSVWDVMLINSARANKEDELQAVSLYNMAGWINDNEPLIDKDFNKPYQIDRSTKTIARTGIVEALQKGWISENHPQKRSQHSKQNQGRFRKIPRYRSVS